MTQDRIKNGQFVQDVFTGFTGYVTGLVHYITGCDQALVTPFAERKAYEKEPSQAEPKWFDVDRLKVLKDEIVSLPGHENASSDTKKNVGFDIQPPIR